MFLSAIAAASQSLHLLLTIFTMGQQDFRCAIPDLPNDTYHIQNEAHHRLLNLSVPYDKTEGGYSQCYRHKSSPVDPDANVSTTFMSKSPALTRCTKWVYSTDVFKTSMISQFDLVCDRNMYTSHVNMMTMVGMMVGAMLSGVLSDRFGRKQPFLWMTWVHFVCAIAMAFVKSVAVLLIMRFVLAVSCVGFFATATVLSMEIVSSKKRTMAGMITMFGWSLGMFLLVLAAFFIRNWQTLQLSLACPMIIIAVSYIWLLPESPRWLLSKGRYSEANVILRTMARVNKREIPEKMLMSEVTENESSLTDSNDDDSIPNEDDTEEKEDETEQKGKSQSIFRLMKTPVLLLRLIILAYGWLVNSMVYYGLTLNVGSIIEGDIYLNFFIMSVLELVCYVMLVFFLTGPFGRKRVFCACILLGGVACLSTMFPIVLEWDVAWMNPVLSNLGKFFITSSFALVWIYTPELIPTRVRQSGLGICSMTGRIGGIVSPYIGSLSDSIPGPVGQVLPLVVFGSTAILCGILALFLPETANRKLPETIEEAKAMSW
ncbi:organic cation transporter protein [Elysia marginata]|uniref:Organic cation transporter protein n=1 Tax=Elysia marginata TaxID=1093978 RepID=A0AAV4FQX8_9GAST|nr:organic cation transporter protein [Elysia marginata]